MGLYYHYVFQFKQQKSLSVFIGSESILQNCLISVHTNSQKEHTWDLSPIASSPDSHIAGSRLKNRATALGTVATVSCHPKTLSNVLTHLQRKLQSHGPG